MAMADTADRPTLEERYLAAATTSDLTIGDVNSRTQADLILAAGMSRNQLGAALVHLKSEWDRADKPRKATPAEIAARALELPKRKGKIDLRRAEAMALVLHAQALRARSMALSGRSVVMGLLRDWAAIRSIDPDVLSPAVFHWLAPRCPVCEGHGKLRIADTPVLGKKSCHHCNGAGTWPEPLGAHDVKTHIARCVIDHQKGMAGAFYGG